MKNIMSKLTEKITLLENNDNLDGTTIARFKDSLEARAAITAIFNSNDLSTNMFEVIILNPPPGFGKVNFSGLKWRDEIYTYKTPFKLLKDKFLKGIIVKI
ncbi:MAG: hypothetical protein LBU35_02125 [Holosporales bacterium]|jgi:hypothetical protein|nr:hypothetical protein [Holosporales bacterium]